MSFEAAIHWSVFACDLYKMQIWSNYSLFFTLLSRSPLFSWSNPHSLLWFPRSGFSYLSLSWSLFRLHCIFPSRIWILSTILSVSFPVNLCTFSLSNLQPLRPVRRRSCDFYLMPLFSLRVIVSAFSMSWSYTSQQQKHWVDEGFWGMGFWPGSDKLAQGIFESFNKKGCKMAQQTGHEWTQIPSGNNRGQ